MQSFVIIDFVFLTHDSAIDFDFVFLLRTSAICASTWHSVRHRLTSSSSFAPQPFVQAHGTRFDVGSCSMIALVHQSFLYQIGYKVTLFPLETR